MVLFCGFLWNSTQQIIQMRLAFLIEFSTLCRHRFNSWEMKRNPLNLKYYLWKSCFNYWSLTCTTSLWSMPRAHVKISDHFYHVDVGPSNIKFQTWMLGHESGNLNLQTQIFELFQICWRPCQSLLSITLKCMDAHVLVHALF